MWLVYGAGSGLSVLPRRRPEDEHIFGRAAELALLVALGSRRPGRKYAQAKLADGGERTNRPHDWRVGRMSAIE